MGRRKGRSWSRGKRSYGDVDRNQLNQCTICIFKSHVKSNFQRHLMKNHGIKLAHLEANVTGHFSTLGRVINDYALEDKFRPKEIYRFSCNNCKKAFATHMSMISHKTKCDKLFRLMEQQGGRAYTCDLCQSIFSKATFLNRHLKVCGTTKGICCQICPYKVVTASKMQRHLIDKHNLLAKLVEEPDFEEALNGTPYILERPAVLEALPTSMEEAHLLPRVEDRILLEKALQFKQNYGTSVGMTPSGRIKKLFKCDACKREFMKQRFLNKHIKNDECWI